MLNVGAVLFGCSVEIMPWCGARVDYGGVVRIVFR